MKSVIAALAVVLVQSTVWAQASQTITECWDHAGTFAVEYDHSSQVGTLYKYENPDTAYVIKKVSGSLNTQEKSQKIELKFSLKKSNTYLIGSNKFQLEEETCTPQQETLVSDSYYSDAALKVTDVSARVLSQFGLKKQKSVQMTCNTYVNTVVKCSSKGTWTVAP